MQRVRLKRLARRFRGDAIEHARAEEIDDDRPCNNGEGRYRCFDGVALAGEQAVPRLPQNDGGEEEQEGGLDERRHALDFAVTVMVFLVGRLVRNADGKIGHGGRHEIEHRMRRFREDRERAGREPDDRLADGERRRRTDRAERDTLLFAAVIFAGCHHGRSILAVATGVNAPGMLNLLRWRVVQMTRREVPLADRPQHRLLDPAAVEGERAARVEAAAGRRS